MLIIIREVIMIRFIKDIDVKNKTALVRVDYNVPIKDGKVVSAKKIEDSFTTIDYLVNSGAKVILLSHFGRVKKTEDKENNSLKPVYEYIAGLNKYNISFVASSMGADVDEKISTLQSGEIVLLENTRFLDLEGNLESGNDIQLAMYWASLADLYVDDAFGSMHRNHASVVGVARQLPSVAGFLVEKELANLNYIIDKPKSPFVVLMGGAKLDDKIDLLYALLEKADTILLGGGIANTFLKASGINTGASLVSDASLDKAREILIEFRDKLMLPVDAITSPTYTDTEYSLKGLDNIGVDDVIGDIGSKTVEEYKKYIENAETIFVNGTVGMYETKGFSNGTREILDAVVKSKAYKVIGGGDAGSSLKSFGLEDKVDFISTGGGAALSYIAYGTLPGLEVLENAYEEDIR